MNQITAPTTNKDIINAIKNTSGKISIGGGRFSMGGQIATENSLHLDMRQFNKIIKLEKEKMQVTVQSGIRWRDLQEEIDKHDLSIKIMQTYANFTVGGPSVLIAMAATPEKVPLSDLWILLKLF